MAVVVIYFFISQPIDTSNFILRESIFHIGAKEKYRDGLHYYEIGACENNSCQCTLLIHGLGDYALTWVPFMHTLTDKQIKNNKIFALNLPGSGRSEPLKLNLDYSIKNVAKIIENNILNQCESWQIIGNSLGGWIAFYVAQHPKVNRLFLENSVGIRWNYDSAIETFLDINAKNVEKMYNKTYFNQYPIPHFVFEALAHRLKNMPVQNYIDNLKNETFIDNKLQKFQKETVVIWGEEDKLFPVEMSQIYKKLNPNIKLITLPQCGHLPHKECPHEVNSYLFETK